MSLSTLANTKWLLNSSIQFDPQYPFQGANINFVSNSTLYSYLDVTDDHDEEIYYGTSASSKTAVYTNSAWINSAYRTIYFIDGADIANTDVIDWLELSGTQIDVDIEAVNTDALDSALLGVADAIRAKSGGSTSLTFPGGFVTEIGNIPTGGGGDDTLAAAMVMGTISGIYSNSSVTQVRPRAFYYCQQLGGVSLPLCSTVGSYAFFPCTSLSTAFIPSCEALERSAFEGCVSLSEILLPVCSRLAQGALSSCTSLQNVSLPICTELGLGAFQGCTLLSTISLPSVTIVGDSAFYQCTALEQISLPICTQVGIQAFQECAALTAISLPFVTSIGSSAFLGCGQVSSIYLPLCSSLPQAVFSGCRKMQSLTMAFSRVTQVGAQAFYQCSLVFSSLDLPLCVSVYSSAFLGCTALQTVILSACLSLYSAAFSGCTNLQSLIIPVCKSIAQSGISNCTYLSYVYGTGLTIATTVFRSRYSLQTKILGSACSYIGQSAFGNCRNLLSVYLLGSTVCKLSANNAFTGTPISNSTASTGGVHGSVFVPASLYDAYKTSTNWVNYAARIVSLTDAEIAQILIY